MIIFYNIHFKMINIINIVLCKLIIVKFNKFKILYFKTILYKKTKLFTSKMKFN